MAKRRVFICYSRKDRYYFRELVTLLAPLQERGQLRVWTDLELRKGADWEERILQEIDRADASIVLVSPHLLASAFVSQVELPRLLEARELRGLKLSPLFVRHCLHDLAGFTIRTGDGSKEVFLDEIQGLNLPNKPLANLKRPEREALLTAAVRDFLAELMAAADARTRRQHARRELAVKLELREGGQQLLRRFGEAPGFDLYGSQTPISLSRLGETARRDPSNAALGHDLFNLLMGSEPQRTKVLTMASGRDTPDPLLRTFRVRILSDERELRGLPWAACRWRDHLLSEMGWTFELMPSEVKPRSFELDTPCRALAILGEPEEGLVLGTDIHARTFENLLRRAWDSPLKPKLLQTARTQAAVDVQLRRKPHLVYVYAQARDGRRGLRLMLEDSTRQPSWMDFVDLVKLLERNPPSLLVLNTVGECPLVEPIPAIDTVFHLRHHDGDWTARSETAAWWNAVLSEQMDPVRAFYSLDIDVRHRGAIYARYQRWTLEHTEAVSKVDRPRAHLDRRDQRRVVRDAVSELVNIPRRRVTCLVAYGSRGNLVEHFAIQVLATMKEQPPPPPGQYGASLEHKKVRLPEQREALTRELMLQELRTSLALQPGQPLAAAFQRPRRTGPRIRPVYFLDWGTFGRGHQPEVYSGHLASWAELCCYDLRNVCPPSARIVAYISLVSPKARHPRLKELLSSMLRIRRYRKRHFQLIDIPPLPELQPDDLLRFLANEHNSSCPTALHQDLAERIVLETGGSFQATVELLEEAERGFLWFELDERLPRPDAEPELPRDIQL